MTKDLNRANEVSWGQLADIVNIIGEQAYMDRQEEIAPAMKDVTPQKKALKMEESFSSPIIKE